MGKVNNVINNYFRNKQRFADLFNGIYFDGNSVLMPEQMEDVSTVYYECIPTNNTSTALQSGINRDILLTASASQTKSKKKRSRKPSRREYIRDIRMRLTSGETFQLFALENQDSIDYTMPFRNR